MSFHGYPIHVLLRFVIGLLTLLGRGGLNQPALFSDGNFSMKKQKQKSPPTLKQHPESHPIRVKTFNAKKCEKMRKIDEDIHHSLKTFVLVKLNFQLI